MLGELNKGWTIAKKMLQHERNMMGQNSIGEPYNPKLSDLVARYIGLENNKIADGELRAKIAGNEMDMHTVDITASRVMAEMKAGEGGAATSILKYVMTLAYQEKFELVLTILGHKALGWHHEGGFTAEELRASKEWAFSKIQTIGGGTSEIQLNIIAKHILGLPE